MENVFVLIGFAGEDPNFLEWTGWVRDELGDRAPKLYLCGLLDLSPAVQGLLSSRQVTPIDLSVLFPDVTENQRHTRAMDWFLAALEGGRPGRPHNWAPSEPVVVPERQPALPPARVFTSFGEHPQMTETADSKTSLDELRTVARIWRTQREEYPGWHIPPDAVRDRLWRRTEDWRSVVFSRAKMLGPHERLLIVRELCWRLELCLSPIFTDETDELAVWLEMVNPFGSKLEMPGASVPGPGEEAPLREAWVSLALYVLRTAREDLNEARYEIWRTRLQAVAGDDPAIVGELRHEDVLLQLNRLDLGAVSAALARWRAEARQPLEFARLGALYAELGDKGIAADLAMAALNAARLGNRTPATISLEAWCCLLLDTLHWNESLKRAEWRERMALAKEQGYDPWETLASLRHDLGHTRPQRRKGKELKAGFNAGEIQTVQNFARGDDPIMPAFRLLRLSERAPCPFFAGEFGLLADTACNAAVWIEDAAPFWSFSILLRAGARPEKVHEAFDRASVALIDISRVAQLRLQLMRVVSGGIAELSSNVRNSWSAPGRRILGTAIDVLSRIALRLDRTELEALLAQTLGWLSTPQVVANFDLARLLGVIVDRAIEAMPDEALTLATESLLSAPIFPDSDSHSAAFEQSWPDLFRGNSLRGRSVAPPAEKSKNWQESWNRVSAGLTSTNPELRGRAFSRGFFLHMNKWLDAAEEVAFADAVWSQVDSNTGLPTVRNFRSSVALHLPQAVEHDAARRLKLYLLSREFRPWRNEAGQLNSSHVVSFIDWAGEAAHFFCHPFVAEPTRLVLAVESGEVVDLLGRLLAWWPTVVELLANPRYRDIHFGGFDLSLVVDGFCALLGDSLLMHLPRGHGLAVTAEQHLIALANQGFPVIRAMPGRLFQQPTEMPVVVASMERMLISDNAEQVQSVAQAITRWRRAAAASLIPSIPRCLFDLLLARFALRQRPGLDGVAAYWLRFVEEEPEQLTTEQEKGLFLALDELVDETAPQRLRDRFNQGEIERTDVVSGLHIRNWAAALAAVLTEASTRRGVSLPEVLKKWRTICETDPLPEIRHL